MKYSPNQIDKAALADATRWHGVDVSSLVDADLIEELYRKREFEKLPTVFAISARELLEKQKQRLDAIDAEQAEINALTPSKRRVRQTAAKLQSEPINQDALAYIHTVLAICALPYDKTNVQERTFVRSVGPMTLIVDAGSSIGPDKKVIQHPVPFGPKARMILMYLCTEAIRRKSRTIPLTDTFTAFVRQMGFSNSGGKRGALTAFREQINALAYCTMRVSSNYTDRYTTQSFVPFDEFSVWLSPDDKQQSLWPSTITFSEKMYNSLVRHAVPFNMDIIKAIQGSAFKIDLYLWLSWRSYNIKAPLFLTWENVFEQFGGSYKNLSDLKRRVLVDLAIIQELLPELRLTESPSGITLHPATSQALALPPKQEPDPEPSQLTSTVPTITKPAGRPRGRPRKDDKTNLKKTNKNRPLGRPKKEK